MAKERREDYPELHLTIQQINNELSSMKEDLHACTEDLKRMNKILNGNGEMGLVASVIALQLSVSNMEKNNTKWSDRVWDRIFIVSGGLALAWIIFQLGIQ